MTYDEFVSAVGAIAAGRTHYVKHETWVRDGCLEDSWAAFVAKSGDSDAECEVGATPEEAIDGLRKRLKVREA